MNSWIKFTEMLFGAGEHITTVGLPETSRLLNKT